MTRWKILNILFLALTGLAVACGGAKDDDADHDDGGAKHDGGAMKHDGGAMKGGDMKHDDGAKHDDSAKSDGFSGMSAADAAAAKAQKTCPVSGDPLGGDMGPPTKITVKGRTVFLCCEGCRKKILANPDKYLAKLDGK